jgi:hypothetical protein
VRATPIRRAVGVIGLMATKSKVFANWLFLLKYLST